MKKITAGIILSLVLTALLIGSLSTGSVENAEHGRVFTAVQNL
ncbi:hypothetical protein [Bacillus sp. NEB1478]|nr:hypothetical protein [Bacillus sp. NEB1478]WNB92591.1 hypothetical protein RGB74_02685 [Bacillus sp. NEB1478]